MKFIAEIDPQYDPDAVGEMLRDKFFSQNRTDDWENYSLGCYSTFDIREKVKELPITNFIDGDGDEDTYVKVHNFELDQFKMKYSWDGDGTLEFVLPDNSILINTDCKKTYGWQFFESREKAIEYGGYY